MKCFILLPLFGFIAFTCERSDPCIDQSSTARNLVVCFKSGINDFEKILEDCFYRYCSGIKTITAVTCVWNEFPKCVLSPARCVNYPNAQILVNCMCNI